MGFYERAKLLLPKQHQNYGPLITSMGNTLGELGNFERALAIREEDLEMTKATIGVALKMDGKAERFIGNDHANAMLTREYSAATTYRNWSKISACRSLVSASTSSGHCSPVSSKSSRAT